MCTHTHVTIYTYAWLCKSCLPRLVVYALLNSKPDLFASFGVCCSSWVVASRGSTGRSFITPMGNTAHRGVKVANQMVSRTTFQKTCLTYKGNPSDLPRLSIKDPVGCKDTRIPPSQVSSLGHGAFREITQYKGT